jgi:hypothetical protein
MIDKAHTDGDSNRKRAIRNIAKQEARRRTWQTLRYVRMQKGLTQKLNRIEIPATWPPPHTEITTTNNLEDPKTCTEWTIITEPDKVEYCLLLQNISHFGQADGTPFTRTRPFSEMIPWHANNDSCNDILAGQFTTDINDVPLCTALLNRSSEAKSSASERLLPPHLLAVTLASTNLCMQQDPTSTTKRTPRRQENLKA